MSRNANHPGIQVYVTSVLQTSSFPWFAFINIFRCLSQYKLHILSFAFILYFGMTVHGAPVVIHGKHSLRTVGHRKTVRDGGSSLNTKSPPRALDYYDDFLHGLYDDPICTELADCGALEQECYDYCGCCELTGGGIAVFTIIVIAAVLGIVACSCACCKCCPWHDKMCCARRNNSRVTATASAVAIKDEPVMKSTEEVHASNLGQ